LWTFGGILTVCVLLTAWLLFSEELLPAPPGIPDRYVVRVGPMLRAGVEDTETGTIVLWYDMDTGPDLKDIRRLDNGDWLVTLSPRR
jgi:hypothetical protein